ncbi:MAG: Pyridoxine/pyridoxamine 5'-phosphate oxidase [Chlamydiae bacterium]|nr:Pyridoxine/pyridoxamine 5'-phosphate oxidase [Chlamydiota bacterium]
MIDFSDFRRTFREDEITITKKDLPEDPIELCASWLQEVKEKDILDGNAMTLSTSSKEGRVTARTVLLKYMSQQGFTFFSNYKSKKGLDIEENPQAALTFYWPSLNRQMSIEGNVSKLPKSESSKYYYSRPRLNQLLALSSKQDQEINSLKEIVESIEQFESQYKGKELPIPDYWGGFLLDPTKIEFWQGGQGRINIRYCYQKENGSWIIKQLSP